MSVLPKIVWPIPSNNRGKEFSNLEEILSHLAGESTGQYTIGRSGMWHGGIHITHATTPWCALSGKAPLEAFDFPVPFKGEQAIRCMADGEVVAYRVCRDYLTLAWESGPLSFSGSFVLVKHYIQPGGKESSGLHFYTLYMHLAPYSAYEAEAENQWVIQDTLRAYSEMDWLTAKLTSEKTSPQIAGHMPKEARVEWDPADSNLNATGNNKRKYGLVTLKGLPEDTSSTLTPGKRYWVVVDNNNIKSAPGAGPGWWRQLLPPAKEVMVFDKTVSLSTPFAIKAGDPVGHMGYYQAPKDGGYEARYQVHIECTSMDDNLEKFLTNPERVGEKNPLWLKYAPGLALYKKDIATGTFTKDTRVTTRSGILPLSQVQTEADKSTRQEYWQLRPENAYVPKGQAEPQLLSQYDLARLGFRTETAEPVSFDYLDGKNQPVGFFRSLINSLYEAATGDPRTSHALVKHNYQRLLDKIDSGSDRYSPMEYWRALHNPDYRDVIQKTIVKHPSDWYFKKGDALWQPFLNALKKDAPEWKKYSEDFLDKMAWMQDVTTEKLGPSLWHMHPLMFLGALIKKKTGWAHSKFANFLGHVESKNDYTAYNVHVTYKSHYKTKLTSMTIKEVMTSQDDETSNGMFATGRFQIVPNTLKEAVDKLNLDVNALYDEEMQDKIFNEYLIKLKRPAIIGFLEGSGSVEDAIYDWAKEFASAGVRKGKEISPSKTEFEKNPDGSFVRDKKGRKIHKKRYAQSEGVSYYSGDGINKAHVKPGDMVRILEESKNEGC
ncbi:Phage-related lysozyme (muraminidase) [Salmonella enterica subsp. arizonae]|uniref:Phage-related lysozyme (Muraminidase) n=1 Tax=Salmonella enterica subsp. arizonae TaxID=59203 RepID=A0A379S8F3_SALER|nr:Phage-related lysozyme (muraminidase) [Salmonella enterica subsp. arizonae]